MEYKTKHFKVNGSASIEESIELAITYDAELFGEDYVYCKVISTTTGKVNVDVRAKVDNDEAVKDQTGQGRGQKSAEFRSRSAPDSRFPSR